MEWTKQDPEGVLNEGTRWTIQYGTPHTVRVIHGLYLSDTREDDLIIWTIEKHGVPEGRPYSGRRRSFHRWDPAKAPQFEKDHVYRNDSAEPDVKDHVFRILHVFEDGEDPRVIVLENQDQVFSLYQSERPGYTDITGKDGS